MKLTAAFLSLSVLVCQGLRPHRISFSRLQENDQGVWEALSNVGVISLSDVGLKKDLEPLRDCAVESGQEHVYGDGTRRLTVAHSNQAAEEANSCLKDSPVSQSLNQAAEAFAHAISGKLNKDPIFQGSFKPYQTLEDVVHSSERLEHFHVYSKLSHHDDTSSTIDLHTDQGLFLVFSPAQLLTSSNNKIPQDFSIQLKDGSIEVLELDDKDELVILLGDGMQRIDDRLRSVPHAVTIQESKHERVWFGLMVLPPTDAIVPDQTVTFGELRSNLIRDNQVQGTSEAFAIGCHTGVARQLETITCNSTDLLCWHKCMVLADFGVNETYCSDMELDLACISDANEVWGGEHAPEAGYEPGCIDLANATIAGSTNGDGTSSAFAVAATWMVAFFWLW